MGASHQLRPVPCRGRPGPQPVDCESLSDPVASDTCQLSRSEAIQPAPDCDDADTQFAIDVCSWRNFTARGYALNRTWVDVRARWKSSGDTWAAIVEGREDLAHLPRQAMRGLSKDVCGGSIVPLQVHMCMTALTKDGLAILETWLEER